MNLQYIVCRGRDSKEIYVLHNFKAVQDGSEIEVVSEHQTKEEAVIVGKSLAALECTHLNVWV